MIFLPGYSLITIDVFFFLPAKLDTKRTARVVHLTFLPNLRELPSSKGGIAQAALSYFLGSSFVKGTLPKIYDLKVSYPKCGRKGWRERQFRLCKAAGLCGQDAGE